MSLTREGQQEVAEWIREALRDGYCRIPNFQGEGQKDEIRACAVQLGRELQKNGDIVCFWPPEEGSIPLSLAAGNLWIIGRAFLRRLFIG